MLSRKFQPITQAAMYVLLSLLLFSFCSLKPQNRTSSLPTISYSSSFSHTNHIQVLTQLLKKLQDKLAGGNRRDPFTVLPLEVAELTLRRFSFKQIV
jgi:hypothetical protein